MEKKKQEKNESFNIDKKKLNKVLCVLIGIGLITIVILVCIILGKNRIPKNYKAVFVGEKDKIEYKTYVYDLKDDEESYIYKYINTEDGKVIKKGRAHWVEDILRVANDNNANSYVLDKDGKKYTIDEFFERLQEES